MYTQIDLQDRVTQKQVLYTFTKRVIEKPASTFVSHSPSQQVLLSTTCRGTVLGGGGNQSGKTTIAMAKLAAVADGYHGEVMCPRDCVQWGVGSCGLHGCPGPRNGGTQHPNCVFGRPTFCNIHPPLNSRLPRRLGILGKDFEKVYDLIYRETLIPFLSKTLDGKYKWHEPDQKQGEHHITAKDGSWDIQLMSMEKGTDNVKSIRKLLIVVDELPKFDIYRELRKRIWRENGQILITATHDDLLNENSGGEWIYAHLVGRKSWRVQVLSVSTRNNPAIDKDMLNEEVRFLSAEEEEIYIDGGFGFRQSKCAFTTFAVERQETYEKPPETYFLDGSFAPNEGNADFESYYGGTTRFPEGCKLPDIDRQILIKDREPLQKGGISCSDCLRLCHLYQPPPTSKVKKNVTPRLIKQRIRYPRDGNETPEVHIWELPIPGKVYISGLDTAEGLRHGDFSVIPFFDAMSGNQVAMLRGRWKTREFAYFSYGLRRLYGAAGLPTFCVPEYNGPGATVIDIWMNELGDRNIFFDPERKRTYANGTVAPFPGFLSTAPDKRNRLVAKLEAMMSEGLLKIRSSIVHDELRNFINDGKKLGAIKGSHDDSVISCCLVAVGWDRVRRSLVIDPDLPLEGVDPQSVAWAEKHMNAKREETSDVRSEETMSPTLENFYGRTFDTDVY